MHTHFSRFLVAIFLLVAVFSFYSFDSATTVSAEEPVQEVTKKKKQKLSLAAEIQKFTNALVRLTDVLDKDSGSDTSSEEVSSDVPEGISLQSITNVYFNNYCLQDYTTLPWSYTKKSDLDWDLSFIRPSVSSSSAPIINTIIDLNGDGVTDYVYSQNRASTRSWPENGGYTRATINEELTCVNMGFGSGQGDLYQCRSVFDTTGNKMKYYGDCADLSA